MHTELKATTSSAATADMPKFDQKLTLRLDVAGMRELRRRAAAEFLDPAIYGRQVLKKHLAALEAADKAAEGERAA